MCILRIPEEFSSRAAALGLGDGPDEAMLTRLSQEWLDRRLANADHEDLQRNIRVCSLGQLTPPAAWRPIWATREGGRGGVPPLRQLLAVAEGQAPIDAVVVFGNPFDEAQITLLLETVQAFNTYGEDCPFLMWVPHSLVPEVGFDTREDIARIAEPLLHAGIDAMLDDEPEGLGFTLALQLRLSALEAQATRVEKQMERCRALDTRAKHLEHNLNKLLWNYVPSTAARSIPKVDPQIPAGKVDQLAGYDVGTMLGRGACGTVRMLHPHVVVEGGAEPGHVVKIMEKSSVTDVGSIMKLRREIEIMGVLGDQWKHPNLVGLHRALCSPTHVFLIMDFAGPMNLYRRLAHRDVQDGRRRPLSTAASVSIIEQAIAAVGHLHLGPQVCHRDIKPENFVVDDVNGSVVLKLTDFDVSCWQREGGSCHCMCGTMPFVAPEVLIDRAYCGRAADLWSLAVVLLEILCCSRILEKALVGTFRAAGGAPPSREVAEDIAATFSEEGTVQNILRDHTRRELVALEPAAQPLLEGMLTVDPRRRWQTEQVVSAAQTLAYFAGDGDGAVPAM